MGKKAICQAITKMNEPCKNPIAEGNSKYCSLHADDKKRVHIDQMKTSISQKEAQTIVQTRKDKGRWMDASKKAKLVFTQPNKYWAKNPGKADVKAIDDGSQEAKQLSPSPERKPKQKRPKKEKKPKKAKAPLPVPKQPKRNRVKFSIKALERRIIKYLNWKYTKKENRFISPNEGALLLLNPLESYSEVIPQTFIRYKINPSLEQFTKITIGKKSLYFDVTFINCMNYLLRTGIQNVKIGFSGENVVVKVFHNFTFVFGSEESVPASVEKKLEKKQETKPEKVLVTVKMLRDELISHRKISNPTDHHYNGGWFKTVTGLNKDHGDGFSIIGDFIGFGGDLRRTPSLNHPILSGTLLLDCSIQGSRKNQYKHYYLFKIQKDGAKFLVETEDASWATDMWGTIEQNL